MKAKDWEDRVVELAFTTENLETGETHLKPYPQLVEDSFKAGQEFAEKAIQNHLLEIIEASKQAGMKEVVEWLKERVFDIGEPIPVGDSVYARFRKPLSQVELETKLKEWEL